MKKTVLIRLLSITVLFAACNKQLEIAPENTLTDKDVFATEAGSEQALAEAYYNLYKAATGSISYAFGDFTTTILKTNAYYNTYANGEATTADDAVATVWRAYYKAINSANNVIARVKEFGTFDETAKARITAESRFIRALATLDLLRMFGDGALTGKTDGLGPPLQLTPFEGYNTGDVIPRSTNAQVYAQIKTDLEESMPSLPVKFNTDLKTRSRATKGAANALLARCYLYMRNYESAAEAAKKVLDDPEDVYELSASLLSVFPANSGTAQALSREHVLAYPVSHITSASTAENNNLGNAYFFKRSFWINAAFMATFEQNDLRVSQLMFKGDQVYNTNNLNEYTTFKFNNQNGRDNVPVIRLAEVMLIRAEALARTTGVTEEAVGWLNGVRSRALPSATPFTTAQFADAATLISAILEQRKFELAFEGHYRYDLIRTGKPLRTPDLPEGKKVLPVPQVEVDISNGVLKQNPGYIS